MGDLTIKQALIGIGASLFDLYLFQIAYGTFWKMREGNRLLKLGFVVVLFSGSFCVALFGNYALNMGWGLCLYFLATCFYKNRFAERVLLSILYFIICNGVETVSGFLLAFAFGREFSHLLGNSLVFYLCGVIISKMMIYIAVKVMRVFKMHNLSGLSFGEIAPAVLLPLSSILVAFTMMRMSPAIARQGIELSVSLILLLLMVSDIYVIYLVGRQAELEYTRQRLLFLEKQNREQIIHYQTLYENQREVREIRHDMKNTMLALSGMLRDGKIGETQNFLDRWNAHLETVNCFTETNIISLDAVISAKQKQAEERKIPFVFHTTPLELRMDEIDFCILIANALDNALEASIQLAPKETGPITLKIQQTEAYLLVEVRNFCRPETVSLPGATSKADTKNHGFGIKNMRTITEKYDGALHLAKERVSDKITLFVLNILLKNR